MPGKAFDDLCRVNVPDALLRQRHAAFPTAGFDIGIRRAHHGAEHQPIRHVILAAIGPGQAPAAQHAAIQQKRVRPFECDRLFGRTVNGKRIGERVHRREEHEPGLGERFARLEHHREFRQLKPSRPDQGACGFV